MKGSGRFTYYSVDVEASGPVPGLYNMVSFAATVIHAAEDRRLRVGETFYAELRPVFAGHDPEANAIHGLDVTRLATEGLEPAAALRALAAFVERTRAPDSEATFVGHVAVFDWMMVAWYAAWCGVPNPFGYKGIDTKSLAMGALGVPWDQTSKESLEARLGLAPQPAASVHRADADAEHQAHLFVALMQHLGLAPRD